MAQVRDFHIYQWHMQAAKMVKCENSDKINNHSTPLIGGETHHTSDENLTRNTDAKGKYMFVV